MKLNDLFPGTVDLLFILFHSVSFRLYLRRSSTTLLSLSTNLHQVRVEFISMEDLWACFDLDLEFYGTCLKIIVFFVLEMKFPLCELNVNSFVQVLPKRFLIFL